MSKVNDNSNQKVFNVFCRQVVRNVKEISLPEPFSNPSLNKETTAVLGVKPSRRIQRLRGIANRFNLKQPKCIQLPEKTGPISRASSSVYNRKS